MSQRRQESRQAQQERRRQERRNKRIEQRRAQTTAASPTAAATRTARVTTARRSARSRRPLWIAAGVIGGVLVVVLALYLFRSQTAPLPGQQFDSNGNDHVALGQPHGSYFSNPPTSGSHLEELPKSGIYSAPRRPEELGHFMEHGGVWVLYPPGTDEQTVKQLTDIVNREIDSNRPTALAQYPPSGYPLPEHPINVIAWQYLLGLDSVDQTKIEDFVERLACHYNPEGGPYCQGVSGSAKTTTKDAGPNGFNAVTPVPTPAAPPLPTPAPGAAASPAPPPPTAAAVGPTPPPGSPPPTP